MRISLGDRRYLSDLEEMADDVAGDLILLAREHRTTDTQHVSDLGSLLSAAMSKYEIEMPEEEIESLLRYMTNDLAQYLVMNPSILRSTVKQALLSEKNEQLHQLLEPLETPQAKRSIDNLPGVYSKRVFIAGPYDDLFTLREIEKCVIAANFEPVIAYDYEVPREKDTPLLNTHDVDILLLHNCRAAVFELTLPAGQYNEAEWAIRHFRIPTLGLCKSRGPSHAPHELVSTMVRDLFDEAGSPIKFYSDTKQLCEIVSSFLEQSSW